MSLLEARAAFLDEALARLKRDDRVVAVLLGGSTERGEADNWSDLDIQVISSETSASVVSSPNEAERFGDLAIWVDCSWNAPVGGTMAFARYLGPEGLIMVDWNAWPLAAACLPSGCRPLWIRPGTAVPTFEGTLHEWISSRPRQTTVPYSYQQRFEWELCMLHIAMARPARQQDATSMCRVVGIREELPKDPIGQLDVIGGHLATIKPWVTPRVFDASVDRLNAIRETLG
jgi:predicted nucleotidyltransferase